MFSEGKAMDMYLSCSANNIGFSAELFSSILGKKLHCNSVDIVEFFVDKTHHNLFKAIILMPGQVFGLMVWLVSDVAYVNCSEFEKLWAMSFAAL